MVQEKFILYLFLVTSLLAGTTMAKTEFITAFCSSGGNYTNTSLFQTNLETALSINSTHINSGFYNFSGGRNSDRVDVIGLCRGDVNPKTCSSCLEDSGQNIRQQCPNQKAAIGWADECMIRYSNRSILHMNETSPAIYMFNNNNASDPTLFNKVVRGLLDKLRAKAAAGGSKLKYATGHTNSTKSSEKIFGLVQCTPDLSPAQCTECLNGTFGVLPRCCDGKVGGRVLGPSCNFRYETYRFYNQTTLPYAPAPAPAPAPYELAPAPQADAPAPPPQEADAPLPSDGPITSPPPQEADAPLPSDGPITSPPVSSTSNNGLPPPPTPQGGVGNINLGIFRLSTLIATISAILIF